MNAIVESKKVKCKVWFCQKKSYSSVGYCAKHLRQYERTGDPLAGSDAQTLNKISLRLRRLLSQIMDAVVWVDGNDIAHCRACDSHSPPHGRIAHKEGCPVEEAKSVLI